MKRARHIGVVIGLGLLAAWLAPPTLANHICYPAECPGGDASVTAILTDPTLTVGEFNPVRVDGTNNGNDSFVKTTLRVRGIPNKTRPRRDIMFVPEDTPYSVFFGVKPRKPGTAELTAKSKAKKDVDPSNNAVTTSVPAT